jgi:hypothetical protein
MRPSFRWADDGVVHIQLGEGWEALQDALEDSLGSRPPRGDDSDPPSTYWLDRVLALMHRSDGSRIELSSGNMSRITLEGTTVTASADYDTFDDVEVGAWEFEMLLRAWRREVLEARSRSEQAYADDHPSCSRTHATLRVFVRGLSADAVSHLLGIEPTRVTNSAPSDSAAHGETSLGWLLNSADHVDSNDLRRHIDFLLDAIDPAELAALSAERGAMADVFCFWESKNGQGGPELEPGQMLRLGEIGLPLVIDCYMPDD